MGAYIENLADTIVRLGGLTVPLHPFFVARVTGLSLVEAVGMGTPARLLGCVAYFDPEATEWRHELGLLVCGHALRWQGLVDAQPARRQLASALGFESADTRDAAEAQHRDAAIIH